jgi:beta-glucanase (GH16 family)
MRGRTSTGTGDGRGAATPWRADRRRRVGVLLIAALCGAMGCSDEEPDGSGPAVVVDTASTGVATTSGGGSVAADDTAGTGVATTSGGGSVAADGTAGTGATTDGGGSVGAQAAPGGPKTVLFDDFDGTSVDPDTWIVLDRISDQANGEVNCVGPENVAVADGVLEIVTRFEDRSCGDSLEDARTMRYTSGQIQQAAAPFLYGTVEVRAKLPGGIGAWPAIWMLGFEWQESQPSTANVEGHRWPEGGWGEIDIAEFMQNEREEVNTVVHYGTFGGTHLQSLPFDATTRFMVYRLQWTPEELVWSVDAEDGEGFRELRSVTGADSVPNVPMYLVIHTAVGGIGGGDPDPASFPQTFEVDYARITQ